MATLFAPFTQRGATLRNRIVVAPMCQYSCVDGVPGDWHLVHLGSRAVGGAGAVIIEATAVTPEGRITPADCGLWNDAQAEAFRRIAAFLREHGAVPGIQLAHAGRKASTEAPWRGGHPLPPAAGGWQTVAPCALPFADGHPLPHELTRVEIQSLVDAFTSAAIRALRAGFELIELHFAHGYLVHEFLSPLSNRRADAYGGDLEGRVRFALEVTRAVRAVWPEERPLWVRISATDWAEGGWDLPQSVELARLLAALGVDLVDCSSGGMVPHAKVPLAPGYQVPFAAAVRRDAGIATAAVGLITEARQAEAILQAGSADVIVMARQLLRDPFFPLHAARELGVDVAWPNQYLRAKG
jgi:2,4-dienoyl-CoA reductase-like NADH-dependent reductase (Old Yellow Enzyme family)